MTAADPEVIDDHLEPSSIPHKKFQLWDIVGVVLLFAAPLIFCNWIHEWRMVDWENAIANDLPDHIPESSIRVYAAGWPWVYYRSFQQHGTQATSLSVLTLLANVLIASLYVGVMTYWLVSQRRQWALKQLQFSLRDVFYAGILIAPLLFAWTRERSIQRMEAEIVERHSRRITSEPIRVRRFPRCLAGFGSKVLSSFSFRRIELMQYDLALPEVQEDATKLTLATRVVFQTSDKLERPIEFLPQQDSILRAEFRNLRISESGTQAISSWHNATLLVFENCDLDLASLNEQPPCTKVRHILAWDSKIGGSKIQWQKVFPNLTSLLLPVPEEKPAKYQIKDHLSLQTVTMGNKRQLQHRASCRLSLENLPQLENLNLTTFCKLDLELKKIPRLSLLTNNSTGYTKWLTDDSGRPISNPLYPMFGRSAFEDLPSLTSMEFNVRHFESISIQSTPSLQHMSISAAFRDGGSEGELPQELEIACNQYRRGTENPFGLQKLFDEIATVDSLESIKVNGAPLVGIQFDTLSKMPKLKWLGLNTCFLRDDELNSLASISNLERLELADNLFENFDSNRLPGLKSLQYLSLYKNNAEFNSDRSPKRIVLDGWKTIREIRYGVTNKLKTVVMKDLPMATFTLRIDTPLDELLLENVPGLWSLDVRGPATKNTRLIGENGLQWLIFRHPRVTDDVFGRLEKLDKLSNINLGTSSLSASVLESIGKLPNLEYLVLDGTDTTDDIVKQWTCLPTLKGLDISGTKVTNEGLKYILENSQLTRLIAGNTKLDAGIGPSLAAEKQLQILSLRNLDLAPGDFDFLDELTNLHLLDISGTGANSAIIEWLVTDNRLRGLVFENCPEVKNPGILKLIDDRLRDIALGVTGSGLEAFVSANSSNRLRVLEPKWEEGFWASYQIPQ